MTIEIALLVAGGVLISTLIWRLHRLTKRSREIQGEVDALRNMVSRVFLMRLNSETEDKPSSFGAAPSPPSSDATAKNEVRVYAAPQLETVEIDELCAKLATLVPPQQAATLLVPDTAPSGVRERRLVSRHQASRIGKIILYRGRPAGICMISNVSPDGALLLVANAHGLPKQFDLDMDGYRRPCTARWRQLDRVGVKFESTPAA
jgi:hypothetical protein